jgi:hypothetical protein
MSPLGHARAAAGLFAAEAIFPVAHRLTGGAYHGFSHGHDVVIDTGLTIVWLTAAVVGFLGRPRNGPGILLAGAAVSIIHGFMFSVATCDVGPRGAGLPFLLAAALQSYFIAHSFPAFTEEEQRARAEARRHEPPHVWHIGPLRWRARQAH